MKKNNYSYVGISFIILIFGIYVVPKVVDKFKNKSNLHTYSKVPDFEFINQHGNKITNEDYKGKVYVVEFFFTTCPTICPLMTKQLLKIQDDFILEPKFGIASISITPDIDTPEKLKEYSKRYKIHHKNWNLLTGKPSDYVYTLSNHGFKLYSGKTGNNEHSGFEHSGLFALIDKKGYIRSRYDQYGNPIMYYRALEEQGFKDQIKELKEDIKLLLNE